VLSGAKASAAPGRKTGGALSTVNQAEVKADWK